MNILFLVLSLCCITISAIGLKLSLKDLKNTGNITHVLTGKILSYNYDQYNRYASYYLQTNVNGELIALEISDLYIEYFKKGEFEETYLLDNDYTFVVLEDDYSDQDVIPIIGLKSGSAVFLDENNVLKVNNFNLYLGIILSIILLIGGAFIFYLAFKYGSIYKKSPIL